MENCNKTTSFRLSARVMLLNAGADAIVILGVIALGDAVVLCIVKNNLAL